MAYGYSILKGFIDPVFSIPFHLLPASEKLKKKKRVRFENMHAVDDRSKKFPTKVKQIRN
jgi:hypothetical protein